MRIGDLFSGIGGFSLAAHWMGWETAWFSEIDPFASRVLAKHWPAVPNLGDITRIDWSTVAPVDGIAGGFPCQPHSLAGKRLASNDDRDLFDEIIRALRVLRPRFAVLENVPGLLTSERGQFFGRVLGSLAALGYDAEWRVLSASDVGAPHLRERVWIVAYADGAQRWAHIAARNDSDGRDAWRSKEAGGLAARRARMGDSIGEGESQLQGMQPDIGRRPRRAGVELGNAGRARGTSRVSGPHSRKEGLARVHHHASDALHWGDAVALCGVDGTVRAIPRDAAESGPQSPLWPVAHGIPARVAQLRGIGNSIVPRCALEIFQEVEAQMRVAA